MQRSAQLPCSALVQADNQTRPVVIDVEAVVVHPVLRRLEPANRGVAWRPAEAACRHVEDPPEGTRLEELKAFRLCWSFAHHPMRMRPADRERDSVILRFGDFVS